MPLAEIFLLEGSSEGFLSLIEKWRNSAKKGKGSSLDLEAR
jgi:hypothetical protein